MEAICAKCVELERVELEQRVDRLTEFVWEHVIASDCMEKRGPGCRVSENGKCEEAYCPNFSWQQSGLSN